MESYAFKLFDIVKFVHILMSIYKLERVNTKDSEKGNIVLHTKGAKSLKEADTLFMFSEGDEGYSHCITFRFIAKDKLKTMSVYQFIMEYFIVDLIKHTQPHLLTNHIGLRAEGIRGIIIDQKDRRHIIDYICTLYAPYKNKNEKSKEGIEKVRNGFYD